MTKPTQILVWVLAPVAVWAGTFSVGWVGATIGGRLIWLIVGGVLGGLAAIVGWSYLIRYMNRRSAEKT